jgi:hypothetical protein
LRFARRPIGSRPRRVDYGLLQTSFREASYNRLASLLYVTQTSLALAGLGEYDIEIQLQ